MSAPAPHTPGPWRAVWNDDGQDYRLSIVKDTEITPEIAKVFTENVTDDQAEADARLIAAAPELLATIEALCDWWATLRSMLPEMCSQHSRAIMLNEKADEARALLARIEGKEPTP